MITAQRKMRLKRKIQESRGRLMEEHPYFALLLMYLKFVAVPGMKKMSTNGRCIYFDPDYVDKLHYYELDYILCHQVMHIINGHIWRPLDLEGDDYHFACDISLNRMLAKYGFDRDQYPHLGHVCRTIPGVDMSVEGMTPRQIYQNLGYSLYILDERARSRYLSDSELWWDHKDDVGHGGEIILDIPDMTGRFADGGAGGAGAGQQNGGSDDFRQQWHARMAGAASSMSDSGRKGTGAVPDFVQRIIGKMREPVIDWRKALDTFVQEQVCDYSFSPPDRRFDETGFFLPDFNERNFVSREVLFMADTSGSVSDEELALVYSEIKGALEQYNGKLMGKLGFFDAEVKEARAFESFDDLMSIVPYGGGGTDFCVIFDYIRQESANSLPACVVIFTDGCGPYPPQEAALGVPVLWVINNDYAAPPWGRVTRVLMENKRR